MKPILHGVTITGADDRVDISELESLTEAYPFVEWGILLRRSRMDDPQSRYPSKQWLRQLVERVRRNLHGAHIIENPLFISGHLCGRWAVKVCAGRWEFFEQYPELVPAFSRWQMNISPYYGAINQDSAGFFAGIPQVATNIQFIFQFTDEIGARWVREAQKRRTNAACLWDTSGGRGILPKEYPAELLQSFTENQPRLGVAGGLGLDNLQEQLDFLGGTVRCPIWIDIETGARTDDRFDLVKVEAILSIAQQWLVPNWYTTR